MDANMQALQQELQELLQELDGLLEEKKVLEERLTAALNKTTCSDDYRQVCNMMAAHPYGYHGQIQRLELKKYWASEHDDIVYTHGDLAYYGQNGVREYYVNGTDKMKARHRQTVKQLYGQEYQEGQAPSYRTIHQVNTPYVEIAADRGTAQGVFGDIGFVTSVQPDGNSMGERSLSRYSGEFVRESDGWKLWHRADYRDVALDNYDRYSLRGGEIGGKIRIEDEYPFTDDELPMLGIKTLSQKETPGGYDNWIESVYEPELPDPYPTWDNSRSCIHVIADGYDHMRAD